MSADEIDWDVTSSIIAEVEQIFIRDDDIREIKDIAKMKNEIEIHLTNALKNAKDLIKSNSKSYHTHLKLTWLTNSASKYYCTQGNRDSLNIWGEIKLTVMIYIAFGSFILLSFNIRWNTRRALRKLTRSIQRLWRILIISGKESRIQGKILRAFKRKQRSFTAKNWTKMLLCP